MAQKIPLKLTPEQYVQVSTELWRSAEDALIEVKKVWDKNWALYNNQYDWKGKADWQSRVFMPKFPMAVKLAAATFKRALVSATPEWHSVKGMKPQADTVNALLKAVLKQNAFVDGFVEASESSLLSSFIVYKAYAVREPYEELTFDEGKMALAAADGKEYEPEHVEKVRTRVVIEPVNPYDFRIDPTGRRMYVAHRFRMDYYDLLGLAKAGEYDLEAVNKLAGESAPQTQEEYEKARREGRKQTNPKSRPEVELIEYWGDLLDPDGKLIHRNVTWTIANGKYLLRVMKNPYWYRSNRKNVLGPFVWGNPVRKPFSVFHKTLMEDVQGIAGALTEMLNLMMDGTAYSTGQVFELNIDRVVNPEAVKDGISPGKVFLTRSDSMDMSPALKQTPFAGVNPQSMNTVGLLDRAFQEGSGITEIKMGLAPMKGTPTATEIAQRQAESNGLFDTLARNLEDQLLVPLLEMVYWLVMQYVDDFTDPTIVEMVGEVEAIKLTSMTVQDRYAYLKGDYTFEARGMSVFLTKNQELEKIISVWRNFGRYPVFLQVVNIGKLLEKLFDAFNWQTDELLNEDFLKVMTMQQKMQVQQMLAQLQGAAGAGPMVAPAAPGQPGPVPPGAPAQQPGGGIPPEAMMALMAGAQGGR